MKVLVIIVSYNFTPWIDRCLGSLRRQTLHSDVLVLDNASTDDTVARIRRDYSEVELVENGANLGFARGNNIGLQQALERGYDATLLLNADAWLQADDTLEKLVAMHQKYLEYGILSPIHLTGAGDRLEHGFATYVGFSQLDEQPDAEVVPATFIDAAVWFVPVTTWRQVGFFSPLFYHYGEDLDFANRLRWHGLRIGYLPHVYACHDREFRPTTRERFFHVESTYHLAEYANMNYTLPRAFAMSVLATVKKATQALFAGRLSDTRRYTAITLRLLCRTPEVLRTRHQYSNC